MSVPSPDKWGRLRQEGHPAKNFFAKTDKCVIIINPYRIGRGPGYQRPPQVSMVFGNDFWEDLDGLIESISTEERIVLGEDLNGHVGEGNVGDEEIMGGTVLEQEIRKDQWLWILGKGWIWRLSILISRRKMNTG